MHLGGLTHSFRDTQASLPSGPVKACVSGALGCTPQRGPGRRAPYHRDARLALADRHGLNVVCDRISHSLDPLGSSSDSKRALGFIYPPGLIARGPFFFCAPRLRQQAVREFSETSEQSKASVVREQFTTRSSKLCSTNANSISAKQ